MTDSVSSPRNPGDAREQAHDVMERAWQEAQREGLWQSYDDTIYGLLDALLAATRDEPCPTCGGRGHAVELPPGAGGLSGDDPADYPCPANCIDGRVPGGPLVILGPERVGWENEAKLLRDAIHDIDEHATPLAEDEDGFVAVGYAISVGCLHRAINLMHQDFSGERLGVGAPLYRAPETGEKP